MSPDVFLVVWTWEVVTLGLLFLMMYERVVAEFEFGWPPYKDSTKWKHRVTLGPNGRAVVLVAIAFLWPISLVYVLFFGAVTFSRDPKG
jgi:hypothetical protein